MNRAHKFSSKVSFARFISYPSLPAIHNEPLLSYAPNSPERAKLRSALNTIKGECPEIPCIVGGKEIRTGVIKKQVMPTNHSHSVCTWHQATPEVLKNAVDAALEGKKYWEKIPIHDKAAVFLKAADLMSTKYRFSTMAALMLGQGKNVYQAEIDSAAETIDFWRFNVKFADDLYKTQPTENSFGCWNRLEYRPLEGFVAAISPFNFLAIGSNLCCSPVLMGNAVVWKPASTAILASYHIYKILEESGLPPGVINFVPSSGGDVEKVVLSHLELGGVHFTGSNEVFSKIWQMIAYNLIPRQYYPRLVGETGGKNFQFVHETADLESAVNSVVRGAFEYQGQKCSATSRLYVPSNIWPEFKEKMLSQIKQIKMGCVEDFESFMCAVIDKNAFDFHVSYIEYGKNDPSCTLIAGGTYDDSKGYFVSPTVFETTNPKCKLMEEEIFGPVLCVYVYKPENFLETMELCDQTSKYGLTGAFFAKDRSAIKQATETFRYGTGNFYVNDKSTGAVVGQQPFGGGRGSGTNDKAGCFANIMRWVSLRTIKESYVPLSDFRYPSNLPEC